MKNHDVHTPVVNPIKSGTQEINHLPTNVILYATYIQELSHDKAGNQK